MKFLTHILLAGLFAVASAFTYSQEIVAQDLQAGGDDVVAVLSQSPDHTVFAQLIEEAQLTETLRQPGPFTILAPNDEAFEPISGELETMREDPQQLQNLLINHLFQGEANSDEVEENFGIDVDEGDIDAANGVIHSIDEVLIQ